jgi:hypothetical protein
MMIRRLIVAGAACLVAPALCGCAFGAKPQPTTDTGQQGDRPVYVVVQGSEDAAQDVKAKRVGAKVSRTDARTPGRRRAHRYHYYPLARVYFAPDRGRYYWLSPHGWRVGTELPPPITLDGEASVVVDLDSDIPYVHHAKVEAAHPGRGTATREAEGKAQRKGK